MNYSYSYSYCLCLFPNLNDAQLGCDLNSYLYSYSTTLNPFSYYFGLFSTFCFELTRCLFVRELNVSSWILSYYSSLVGVICFPFIYFFYTHFIYSVFVFILFIL